MTEQARNLKALDDVAETQGKAVDEAVKDGSPEKRQEVDYLNQVIKTRNPVLKKLFAKHIEDNFDSIIEDRLRLYENNIDKYTATKFINSKVLRYYNNLVLKKTQLKV